MTVRTFAAWVRPVAEVLANDRQRVVAYARLASDDSWASHSAVEGWTNKDLLAHLAGGNDQMLQHILRAVTSRTPVDPKLLDPDTDAENAARVAERRAWSIDDLIAELERDEDEIQSLMSKLTDDDKSFHPAAAKWTLGQLFEIICHERHDIEHLRQMLASSMSAEA